MPWLKNMNQKSWWWLEDSSVSRMSCNSKIIGNSENWAHIGEKAGDHWSLQWKNDWEPVRNEYQKTHFTTPGRQNQCARLFVHVIRKSPFVRGVTMTIMHLCVERQKIHLHMLQAKSKFHLLDYCCTSALVWQFECSFDPKAFSYEGFSVILTLVM